MAKTNTYRRWTAEEISYLWKYYNTDERGLTALEIADILGRTEDSVFEKAVREGLAKKGEKRHVANAVETSQA